MHACLHMLAPVCTAHAHFCTNLPSKGARLSAQGGQHARQRMRVCFLATWRRGKAHIMREVPAEGRAGRREAAITRARGSMRLSRAHDRENQTPEIRAAHCRHRSTGTKTRCKQRSRQRGRTDRGIPPLTSLLPALRLAASRLLSASLSGTHRINGNCSVLVII